MPSWNAGMPAYLQVQKVCGHSPDVSGRISDVHRGRDLVTGPEIVPGQADVAPAIRHTHRAAAHKKARSVVFEKRVSSIPMKKEK
jgi:hypothetical protein